MAVRRQSLSAGKGRLAAFALAFPLLAAACGGGSNGETLPAGAPTEAASNPLLEGEFPTLAGDTIDLGSLQGQDVVFWFWAPW